MLKPLEILEWKWGNITMDFLVKLPHSPRVKDAIWVVIDRLTKVVHFIPMKTSNSIIVLVPFFIKEIVRLHGVPKSIVSDQDFKFVSNLCKDCIVLCAQKLDLSTFFHPDRWPV